MYFRFFCRAGHSSGRSAGKPVDAAPPTSHRCATTCRCYTCSCRCCSARSARPPMRGGGAAARTGQWSTQMATPTETPTETPTAAPSRRSSFAPRGRGAPWVLSPSSDGLVLPTLHVARQPHAVTRPPGASAHIARRGRTLAVSRDASSRYAFYVLAKIV